MSTLVTGGRGFIGRYIVNQLAQSGEKVVSYNRDYHVETSPNVTAVFGELFDVPRLSDTLERYDVQRIIHTAGMSHPALSIDVPITTFAANVEGTLGVFESARAAGIRRIVNFSSEAVYGNVDHDVLVTEDSPFDPTTPYAVTKVTGELLSKVFNDLHDMDIVSLRITEVYGPGLWMPSVVADMVKAALSRAPYRVPEDYKLQLVHASDVARAACLAASSTMMSKPAYNISGGMNVKVSTIADAICSSAHSGRIEVGPAILPHEDHCGAFDLSAAQQDLGYVPQISLEEGINELVEFYRSSQSP